MALRPIKPEEKALIEALLALSNAPQSYTIPEAVQNLGGGGEGGIQLSSRGQHANDLVEATYRDTDGREVYITLTTNDLGELYDLDLWKVDFSPLQQYPAPGSIRLAE